MGISTRKEVSVMQKAKAMVTPAIVGKGWQVHIVVARGVQTLSPRYQTEESARKAAAKINARCQ